MASPDVAVGGSVTPDRSLSLFRVFLRRFMKNKLAVAGACLLMVLFAVSIAAPILSPMPPEHIILADRLKSPGTLNAETGQEYLLGTDSYGRDILSRILYGSQISLRIGFISMSIAVLVGTIIGAVAGFYGRWVDSILMRLTDIVISMPTLVLLIVIIAFVGRSIELLMAVIGLTSWPGVARLVRGEILSLRERDYVHAARAAGAPDARIIIKHMLPNVFTVLIVTATFRVANAMLTEAILSFLGIGVQPPTPSWGNMLYESQHYLRQAWWASTFPGLAIFISLLCFYSVGDGLRDALDPRLRGQQ